MHSLVFLVWVTRIPNLHPVLCDVLSLIDHLDLMILQHSHLSNAGLFVAWQQSDCLSSPSALPAEGRATFRHFCHLRSLYPPLV